MAMSGAPEAQAKAGKSVEGTNKPDIVSMFIGALKTFVNGALERAKLQSCVNQRADLETQAIAMRYDIAVRVQPELFDIYTVKDGDTLESIKKQFNMDHWVKALLNEMYRGRPLNPGEKIGLPKNTEAMDVLLARFSPSDMETGGRGNHQFVSRTDYDPNGAEYFDDNARECATAPSPTEVSVCMGDKVRGAMIFLDTCEDGLDDLSPRQRRTHEKAEAKEQEKHDKAFVAKSEKLDVCVGELAKDKAAHSALTAVQAQLHKGSIPAVEFHSR